jgi:hypothetical protein
MNELFRPKPWEFTGRRTERNAPSGTLCSVSPWCTAPKPRGNMAHCATCHMSYSGVWAFDKHRKDGWCLDPVKCGLVQDDEGIWRCPPMSPDYKASREVLAATRRRRKP